MASTTSGTTSFSMDVDEIIEQALDPLGGEHTSGIEASKARRTLNLLLIELQNKNIPLNKVDTTTLPLIQGQQAYELDSSIVDVLYLSIMLNGLEIEIEPYSQAQFQTIPNKTIEERPVVWTRQRLNDGVTLKFWPLPPDDTFTATMLVYRKIEDINASYQRLDLPTRYLPLVVRLLSYELSLTRPQIPQDVRAELKSKRDEAMSDAFEEDRERVDFVVRPGGISGR